MKRQKVRLAAFFSLALVAGLSLALAFWPVLTIWGEGKLLFIGAAKAGDALSIHFIHSVQKTKVEENHIVNENCDGFLLKSTKYQSFGVGLPFLASEGRFRVEGDYFIIDDFDRPFQKLDLRAGVGTQLTLVYRGEERPVYQQVPAGGRIEVKVGRLYQILN